MDFLSTGNALCLFKELNCPCSFSLVLGGERFCGCDVSFEREDIFEGGAQPDDAYAADNYGWQYSYQVAYHSHSQKHVGLCHSQ